MCFQSFVRLLLGDFKLFFSDFVGFFLSVIVTILIESSVTTMQNVIFIGFEHENSPGC